MKRMLALLLCLVMALMLTACSDNTPKAQNTAVPTEAPTEAPTATPTAEPPATPTAEPTPTPTAEPTATPTVEPTEVPAEPVEVALLDCYPYEMDGDTYTYLALALRTPKEARWSLRTKDGELIDTWISSYRNYGGITETEDEKRSILLFDELEGEYAVADLALSVTYTVAGGTEKTELFGDWGECVAADARSEYGVYDFGNYIGFVRGASLSYGSDNVRLTMEMQDIPFGMQSEAEKYTNTAEQFKFYTKEGTPLAEALGYSQFEISGNMWFNIEFALNEGEPDAATGMDMIEELFGYIEYTRDDGEVIRIDVQM